MMGRLCGRAFTALFETNWNAASTALHALIVLIDKSRPLKRRCLFSLSEAAS
jgi:hypothetical protein